MNNCQVPNVGKNLNTHAFPRPQIYLSVSMYNQTKPTFAILLCAPCFTHFRTVCIVDGRVRAQDVRGPRSPALKCVKSTGSADAETCFLFERA